MTFSVTIEKLVYGGSGLGRHQGKVVFVPFSAPGDRLLVRPVEEKSRYIRAEIVRIINPGIGRTAPLCPYFGKCGGCQWQQLDYAHQVEAKRRILEEALRHHCPQTRDLPIAMKECTHVFGYRSRARVQLRKTGSGISVGFYRFGSHAVEDIENCPLLRPTLNAALTSIRQHKLGNDYDPETREMEIACSEEEGKWVASHDKDGFGNDETLRRKIGRFTYSVTASAFFQANDFMISELVALVEEWADLCGGNAALDLFAGVGLFSLPLARRFRKVVAIDNSPTACRLCTLNASAAGASHIETVCADVPLWMKSSASDAKPAFDLIVLDPPRTGAGSEVMNLIREWEPNAIIYVSCDLQTLCRDLVQIPEREYRIDRVEGLDLFPQTYHFETVVRLTRLK